MSAEKTKTGISPQHGGDYGLLQGGGKICKAVHQYSKGKISSENMDVLMDIGHGCMVTRNYIYQRYGGINGLAKVYSGYEVDSEVRAAGFREKIGIPSVYFTAAVDRALGDIKIMWAQVRNGINDAVNRNERFSPEDRHYIRFVLKTDICYWNVLNGKSMPMPEKMQPGYEKVITDFGDGSGQRVESINRYICRQTRKRLHRQHTDNSIECVDYVMLSEGYTVDDIVEAVEPDLYIKGEEYANEGGDITGKIRAERELVERHGGKIAYTTGDVFSSTKLINTALSGLPEDVVRYMEDFGTRYSMADIKKYSDNAEKLRVLVVGDIVIDKYTYCEVHGLMSKDTGYSSRLDYFEEYLGGSLAVARHLCSFTENVTLVSIMGSEEETRLMLLDSLTDRMRLKLARSGAFPTIVKHRYLTRNGKREEYRKIFSINNIPKTMEYEAAARDEFYRSLSERLDEADAVFLCDFGHGLIDEKAKNLIQEKAKYLVLNCQTNSANYGLNIITKYGRADAFTLDQKELRLAYPDIMADEWAALERLAAHLGGVGWLTRGSEGAYGIEGGKIHECKGMNNCPDIYSCPAFTLTVKDTVGAGDAFYAVAGLYAAAGAPAELGLFMGNIAGALGANIVGNKEAVEKVNVLKYAATLMNV